jgi:hypothetical protein
MNNTKVHIGNLEYWDLSQSVFYIMDTSGEKEVFLPLTFNEVSHIHFYKDESERNVDIIPPRLRGKKDKKRKPVRITLNSGRKLRGYVDKKYKFEESTGVFLFPESESIDIQYTYIPKNSIDSIRIGDPYEGG